MEEKDVMKLRNVEGVLLKAPSLLNSCKAVEALAMIILYVPNLYIDNGIKNFVKKKNYDLKPQREDYG